MARNLIMFCYFQAFGFPSCFDAKNKHYIRLYHHLFDLRCSIEVSGVGPHHSLYTSFEEFYIYIYILIKIAYTFFELIGHQT
jgi:hypothetical protein